MLSDLGWTLPLVNFSIVDEVRSSPHSLTVSELTRLLLALRGRRFFWILPIEIVLLGFYFASTDMGPLTILVALACVPIFNLLSAYTALWLLARGRGGAPARLERTITFDAEKIMVRVVNGQEAKFPYSSLHRTRPLAGGTIIEVAPSAGYWIHPKHFSNSEQYAEAHSLMRHATP